MNIHNILSSSISKAILELFSQQVAPDKIILQKTNPEFEGDITLVVFPFVKVSKKSPEETGTAIGEYLKSHCPEIASFNVVKGFLNLLIADAYWLNFFSSVSEKKDFGLKSPGPDSKLVMLEYCSPNTNKPLHLGHIRNILLGWSVSRILEANGNKVVKVNLVNDRGIHICKSMLAWQKWGNGETPESTGLKGDHLVGKYYVEFDKHLKEETSVLLKEGMPDEDAQKNAPLMQEAQEMLRKWEAGDKEVMDLWNKMNAWVYEGFDVTFKSLGVSFDKIYYESNTYLLGKTIAEDGLAKNVFYKKPDGSVWIDLSAEGLDQKLVLRADGTSVYITQDLGTAKMRYDEYKFDELIYTVGNEQDYHFKVLKLILKRMGYSWADGLSHFSYGMVDLPEGKMKSREGTVVDADELIAEMRETAESTTRELGKIEGFSDEEARRLYDTLGMGALKYFILKVDPKKRMVFNPKESIDFNGNTGPFIQYTYARIQSVMRKAAELGIKLQTGRMAALHPDEKKVIVRLHEFPGVLAEAAEKLSPAAIANYVYELAKEYNKFYHELTILKEANTDVRDFRLALSLLTAEIIRRSMDLLGISVPERM